MTLLSAPQDLLGRSALVATSAIAVVLFAWPLVAGALLVPGGLGMTIALVGLPVVVVVASLALDGSLRSTSVLALVAVLSALAAGARVLSVGVGGIEFVFIVVILAGRILGARLGFIVGVIAVGTVFPGLGRVWTLDGIPDVCRGLGSSWCRPAAPLRRPCHTPWSDARARDADGLWSSCLLRLWIDYEPVVLADCCGARDHGFVR